MATIETTKYLYGKDQDGEGCYVPVNATVQMPFSCFTFTHIVLGCAMDDEDEIFIANEDEPTPDDLVVDVFGKKIGICYVEPL